VDSELDAELVAQYRQAIYQVGMGSDAFDVKVNQYSERMFQLMGEKHVSYAAIITAYNPLSQVCDVQRNQAAYHRLRNTLMHTAFPLIESVNIDPFGIWPDERSICVLGIDLETICTMGRKFEQNAIIWIERNGVPQLVILR